MQKATEKYMAWGQNAANAGFLRASQRLALDAGKVLKDTRVIDGPYSETKEIVGGFYVIQASNYDEAVRRTSDHPHMQYGGTIEVRQLHAMENQD
jgi:hypothetical protein